MQGENRAILQTLCRSKVHPDSAILPGRWNHLEFELQPVFFLHTLWTAHALCIVWEIAWLQVE